MPKGSKSEEAEDAPMLPKMKKSTSTSMLNGQGSLPVPSSKSALNLTSGPSALPSRRPSQAGIQGPRDPESGAALFSVASALEEIELAGQVEDTFDPGAAAGAAALVDEQAPRRSFTAKLWRYFFFVHVIGPWKFIRGLGWVLNKWQRLFRPVSVAVYYVSDKMDKVMPTVHYAFIWAWNTISLLLHFLSVFATWGVANILWQHGHGRYSIAIWSLYGASHYLMAVIMYMEMDRVVKTGRYNLAEWWSFLMRLLQVAFWDIQLLASVVHANLMIEGLTQMLLKGYEEARVCLHAIVNTIPMCIMLGLLYDAAVFDWFDVREIGGFDIKSFSNQIWAALALSVVNTLEKAGRAALADPWLHPRNNDRYPLLYMRSNAARLPRGLVLDWLFRCNAQLGSQDQELVLRDIFAVYTFNCKGDVRELCDGHKAILLKKALRTFNGSNKYNKAEVLARRLDKAKFRQSHAIRALDASRISPGRYMSGMLAQVLADANGFDSLNLADNMLGDTAVIEIVDALRTNEVLELTALVLSGNDIGQYACEALASLLASARALQLLVLSNNPIQDQGARSLAEVLATNRLLTRLDLSGARVGPDAGATLGHMLKTNTSLRELDLSGSSLGTLGVDSISKGLRTNTALKDLRLARVGSEDKGAIGIAQALSTNRTLTRLDLSRNPGITDVGAKALTDALQGNSVLQLCDLSGTAVSPSWVKLLTNVITLRESGQAGHQAGLLGARTDKGRPR